MKRILMVALGCLLLAGCGDQSPDQTSRSIQRAIQQECGVAEGREAGGPRTITPVDSDGADGPNYFLVTCVNGKVAVVHA